MMNSKDRVLSAIHHVEPDRVPIGEWQYGPEVTGPLLNENPIAFSGMASAKAYWAGQRDEVIGQWKRVLTALVTKFGWDALLLHVMIGRETRIEAPEPIGEGRWRLANGDTLSYSLETDRLFITAKANPTPPAPPPSPDEIAQTPYTEPTDSELEVIRDMVRQFGKTHFLFSASCGGHPGLGYSDATRNEVEQNWVPLYDDPEAYRDRYLAMLKAPSVREGIKRVKTEGLDGVAMGWDFGMTTGPFMSPQMFRDYIQPHLAGFCDLAHREGLIMLLHSCGNNQALMDYIVEAGVDVYQSIQTEMDIVKMKKRYGKNITLWGGVPAGDLVRSTPAEVRETARHYLQECKPGGGYIFGTSHSIMPGAKYENYQAMLQAHAEFGEYGSVTAKPIGRSESSG